MKHIPPALRLSIERAARIAISLVLVVCASGTSSPVALDRQTPSDQSEAIIAAAQRDMAANHLRSVILRVTVDGRDVATKAMGISAGKSPATTDMHFRNGAVAISYMATLLLQLVDKKVVTLDAPLSTWLPELPRSSQVTLRMLANMTAGYPDYVRDAEFIKENDANVYRQWTPQELIKLGLSSRRVFAPGTNWDYSHTNYVILGRALEKITGMPLATLMQKKLLGPLRLTNTGSESTPAIESPVLHAFTSERREALHIPPGKRFYEESTYWNPSWTLAQGAIQTTNIYDMAATAEAIGTGSLLSPASHAAQIAPSLVGFGHEEKGCEVCHRLDEIYSYGLGVVISGEWILQNPLFGGYGAVEAYLPRKKLAIAVAVTFGEGSFDAKGQYLNPQAAKTIVSDIATIVTGAPLPRR